jgi:hypothetical protein
MAKRALRAIAAPSSFASQVYASIAVLLNSPTKAGKKENDSAAFALHRKCRCAAPSISVEAYGRATALHLDDAINQCPRTDVVASAASHRRRQ